jgi:tetratricopeptide (TPR) repeat protein
MKLEKKHLVVIPLVVSIGVIASFYLAKVKPEQNRKKRSMELYGEGYYAFNSGKYREAINNFNYALVIGLNDYYTFCSYQQIGDAHGFLGEYEQAVEAYNKALNTPIPETFNANSRYASVHHHIGNAYFYDKKYVEAISEYNRAIQMDSTCEYLHSDIGKAYANLGQKEQAIQHCKAAIEKQSHNHTAYKALGDFYSILKEYKLAIDSYNESLTLLEKATPAIQAIYKPDLYLSLGISYHNVRDIRQAIDAYKSAIKGNNKNPYPYYELARIYLHQGEKQAAMELYEDLKKLDNPLSVELLDEIHRVNLR